MIRVDSGANIPSGKSKGTDKNPNPLGLGVCQLLGLDKKEMWALQEQL